MVKIVEMRTVKLEDLNPAPYNPRVELRPEDSEWQKLEKSIDEFGLVDPLVWNERTGNLVGGHQRYSILKHKGVTETQVSVTDLSPEQEKQLNLALNKVGGFWDMVKLRDVLAELDELNLDLTTTGFEPLEVDALLGKIPVGETEPPDGFPSFSPDSIETEHECPKCGYKWS